MQATPPILPGSTVILSKAMSSIVREAARGSSGESGGASGCDTNQILDLITGRPLIVQPTASRMTYPFAHPARVDVGTPRIRAA